MRSFIFKFYVVPRRVYPTKNVLLYVLLPRSQTYFRVATLHFPLEQRKQQHSADQSVRGSNIYLCMARESDAGKEEMSYDSTSLPLAWWCHTNLLHDWCCLCFCIWCSGVQARCPHWTKSLFNNAAISIRASKPHCGAKPYINGTDGNLR